MAGGACQYPPVFRGQRDHPGRGFGHPARRDGAVTVARQDHHAGPNFLNRDIASRSSDHGPGDQAGVVRFLDRLLESAPRDVELPAVQLELVCQTEREVALGPDLVTLLERAVHDGQPWPPVALYGHPSDDLPDACPYRVGPLDGRPARKPKGA